MHTGRTIFAQVMDFLPLPAFRACVARYHPSLTDHIDTLARTPRTTRGYGITPPGPCA